MKKKLLFSVLLILTLGIGLYIWLIHANHNKADGEFEMTVNEQPIQIHRDAYGTAYVFAESKADVIRGQGFVMGQDRLFQIEFYRAFIHGELASILGPSMLPSDIRMRVLGLLPNAQKNFPILNQASKDFLTWYCEGFNDYLELGKEEYPMELGLLGLEPAPLTPMELMAVIHFIGFNHAQNMGDEILSLNLAARMPNAHELLPLNINPDRSQALLFEQDSLPATVSEQVSIQVQQLIEPLLPAPRLGSNNWAISGEKTATGKPIVANDPHLDARLYPGIFYPIGLFCPEFRGVGAALPGIPGLMCGRSEHVAFGVTNGYGDSQDLYIEQSEGDRYEHQGDLVPYETRTERIQIKDSTEVEIEIRSTIRGPIISDFEVFGIMTKDVVSFRWSQAYAQSSSLGIERMLEATDIHEFRQAIGNMDNMFFNFVFADVHGNIAHQSTGLIPQRSYQAGGVPQVVTEEDSWTGFIPKAELPHMINPDRGWVGTANHDTRPDAYPHYYSSHFSPNFRYMRIAEALNQEKAFDWEDMWELILDCKNMQAEQLTPIFISALKNEEDLQDLADILSDWTYMDKIDEVGPTIYHVLFDELVNLILDDDLPDEIESSFWMNRYYWSQNMHQIILERQAFIDNTDTPEQESLDALIREAGWKAKEKLSALFGPNLQDWTWGAIHTVQFSSPISQSGMTSTFLGAELIPKNGSNETLNRGGYNKDETEIFETEWFSSFRMVADLNDEEKIRGVLSGGSAARMLHPHYKSQLETWKTGGWIPYWFSKDKVIEHAEHTLILK